MSIFYHRMDEKLICQKCKNYKRGGKEYKRKEAYNNHESNCPGPQKKKSQNAGEKGEVKVKQDLDANMDNPEFLVPIFGDRASDGIVICGYDEKPTKDITKAGSRYKADVVIYFKKTGKISKISIKCWDGGNPTLMNHTTRNAVVFQENGNLSQCVVNLDKFIDVYKKMRSSTKGVEDVSMMDILDCVPVDDRDAVKKTLIEVTVYFTFYGTGAYESKCPADSVLNITDSKDPSTWKFEICDTPEKKNKYIESILPQLSQVSLRDKKGMPNPTVKDYELKLQACEPWIFRVTNQDTGVIVYKGALNIRY